EAAELLKRTLDLPPEAVTYEWYGDTRPVAPNDTAEGRARNRRVEVEVWYDEVADAVDVEEFVVAQEWRRIKVCRMETVCRLRYVDGQDRRTRIQNLVPPLHYNEETIEVGDEFVAQIRQALANMSDR